MGIGTALNISLTGLRANQAQLDLAANNVANSATPGYSRKRISTQALVAGSSVLGVAPAKVEREIDLQVQRQWRVSAANAEYAAVRAASLNRFDTAIGGPGNANSLDTLFNSFKSAFATLSTSPEDISARINAAAGAEAMANRLRTLSGDVQTLRQEAESSIGVATEEANGLLQRIQNLDRQIVSVGSGGMSTAGLEDERDLAIDKLSELIDIRVEDQAYGAVAIFTTNGTMLYDDFAVELAFDEHGTLTPESLYSANPAERGVGTLRIVSGPGAGLDLFEAGALRSGAIAGYRELRDVTLVEAQAQLDELAAQMALAVSNRSDTGTVAASGAASGFAVDLANFKAGNTVTLSYTDGTGDHTITFVGQNGSTAIDGSYTADPKDTVIAIDVSGGAAGIAAGIQTALDGLAVGFQVSNPSGSQVQILDDGAAGLLDVNSVKASVSTGAIKDDTPASAAFDLFVDGRDNNGYTGISGTASAKLGLASRLAVNPAVKADPANLVLMTSSTSVSDATRADWVLQQIDETSFTFSPSVGIGSSSAPYQGTVGGFLNQIISTQGAQATNAQSISDGQTVVTANLEARYNDSRAVDVDEEMARLIELQAAYMANARIITAVKEMLDALMRI